MPFETSSALARTMDNLFKGLTHVTAYLDDIFITGTAEEEHLHNLEDFLHVCQLLEAGVHLKKEKSVSLPLK